tara:strand:- start:4906 stop:5115 length:210 start_codon:yes stop_codon:yes gene_type:complete
MENSKDILLALGRLEGKVESLIAMQRATDDQMTNLERRVRALELGKSYLMGVAAAVGAATSAFMSWIIK